MSLFHSNDIRPNPPRPSQTGTHMQACVRAVECHLGKLRLRDYRRSSQTGNHGIHRNTRKRESESISLCRVFRWIPWLISDPPVAAIGCCWTESAVRFVRILVAGVITSWGGPAVELEERPVGLAGHQGLGFGPVIVGGNREHFLQKPEPA